MFRTKSISTRAMLSFGGLTAIVFLLGAVALYQINNMRQASLDIDGRWLPGVLKISDINRGFLGVRAGTARLVVQPTQAARKRDILAIERLRNELEENVGSYEASISSAEQRALYEEFKKSLASYLQFQRKIVGFVSDGLLDEAVDVSNGEINIHSSEVAEVLAKLTGLNTSGIARAVEVSERSYSQAINGVVIFLAVATLLTIVLAVLLTRSIVRPLHQALLVAEQVARGDLTKDFQVHGVDEPARLLQALKSMQANLHDALHRINGSSKDLAAAAKGLALTTQSATSDLVQQDREIEQAASAVNEMASVINDVAREAQSTAEASSMTDQVARQGRTQVLHAVNSINELVDGVGRTADQMDVLAGNVDSITTVLDVIRSLAEQTNLLALNAAIEAARAGDAGRSFAVVADEVRALAHRTQRSTEEIEQIIGKIHSGTSQAVSAMRESNLRAKSTLEVAEAAGGALEDITRSVGVIRERNLFVASAFDQQALAATEVSKNLSNIRIYSLRTSEGAGNTQLSSQELGRMAETLEEIVSAFKV
ncbi:methyl-accepting chemotaxis protein [Pseudomonas sp. MOB-449]|nr:methyl-accepting chemotaxis protein [Pseudomonas sp. MOB-449]